MFLLHFGGQNNPMLLEGLLWRKCYGTNHWWVIPLQQKGEKKMFYSQNKWQIISGIRCDPLPLLSINWGRKFTLLMNTKTEPHSEWVIHCDGFTSEIEIKKNCIYLLNLYENSVILCMNLPINGLWLDGEN